MYGQLERAGLETIAVAQLAVAANALAVDVCAVAAAEITDERPTAAVHQDAVAPADGRVLSAQVGVVSAADEKR